MTSQTSSHMHPHLAPRPGEELMAWLDRSAVYFVKEMVVVGLDPSADPSIRFEAVRWLLSRTMAKPRKAQEVNWIEKLQD